MYIYPDIVKHFACEMCGTCCRRPWQVSVEEANYRQSEVLFARTGRSREFSQAFIPLNDRAEYGEYAQIAKQPDGSCWFLEQDNRCRLHREAGHSQLDAVCQTYPRYPMSTARGIELTLSFSCPAVLKLADREEPLAIIRSAEQPLAFPDNSFTVEVYPRQQRATHPLHYYFELETHFIDILQCRQMPLQQRISFLAESVEKIAGLSPAETLGRELTNLFNQNYDQLEALAACQQAVEPECGSGLLENFLVNYVFKKPFYIYGLEKALVLLQRLWRQLAAADNLPQAIIELEFQYGHDRQSLWR